MSRACLSDYNAGIIGALDPYTHKVNTASLSGEGKLELEGVRPLRTNTAAVANIAASIMAGGQLQVQPMVYL
jgi:FKBP12-rapamycin complex-associated protein